MGLSLNLVQQSIRGINTKGPEEAIFQMAANGLYIEGMQRPVLARYSRLGKKVVQSILKNPKVYFCFQMIHGNGYRS